MKSWYYVLFKRLQWDEQVKTDDGPCMKMRNAWHCQPKTTSKGAIEKTWRNACDDNKRFSLYNTCNLLQAAWLVVLYFFPVALEPYSGLGRPTVEVLDHTHTHTHSRLDSSERVINSSQRPLPAQHNKQKRRTSVPSAEFELVFPPVKQLQTYTVDYTECLIYAPKRSHISRVHNVAAAVWLKYKVVQI